MQGQSKTGLMQACIDKFSINGIFLGKRKRVV